MNIADFESVEYRPEYGLETVKMWRQSFQRAMGIDEHNNYNELSKQLDYLCSIDPASIRVVIHNFSSTIVGFMVATPGELHHLYVHVDYHGRGLGTMLLNEVKSQSPLGLELYTFRRNKIAQNFYMKHGFMEIARGFAEAATNSWATTQEDLADLKYRWFQRVMGR